MKSLITVFMLMASVAHADFYEKYTCSDATGEWKVSMSVGNSNRFPGSIQVRLKDYAIIDSNIQSARPTHVGVFYPISNGDEFVIDQVRGETYLMARNQRVDLQCEREGLESGTKGCYVKTCTPQGAATILIQVPTYHKCVPQNIMCKN